MGAAMKNETKTPEANERQLLYAKVLAAGMYIGLATLFVTFTLYLAGIVPPMIPVEDLPKYWDGSRGPSEEIVHTPAGGTVVHEIGPGVQRYLRAVNDEFLHREHLTTGWSWVGCCDKGDYLNFIGIAILAAVTIFCYIAILPILIRKKDTAYVIMATLEVIVLVLAASGIFAVGH